MCTCETVRYNLLLGDKDRGNRFLKWDHSDDEDGVINMNIIMLSSVSNQARGRGRQRGRGRELMIQQILANEKTCYQHARVLVRLQLKTTNVLLI